MRPAATQEGAARLPRRASSLKLADVDHRVVLACAAWAALFALAAALTLQDIYELDYWWMLRSGQLIAETGSVPTQDPFTYTVPGARWIDIHWLFQLGMYGLYAAGGHAAVVIATFGLVCVWLAALAPIGWRPERSWLSVGALALMLLVAATRLNPRPELPSFVLLACVLYLLDRFERTGTRAIYAIVPLQLLWANVHGLFAVGIAVCAIHLAGELMRPLGRAREPLRWPRIRRLAAVTLLSALVSFLNPNGIDGAFYPLTQLGMFTSAEGRRAFGTLIAELRPPLGTLDPLLLALFFGLAALSLGAIAANWRRVREADVLLWSAFFYLAMSAARNVALFAIVAVPILVRNWNEALDARPLRVRTHAWVTALAAGLVLLVVGDVAFGRFNARVGPYRSQGLGVIEGLNPIGAAEWILRTRPPGPLAHGMGDGGYLIWRLWPEYKVMSDGRLEVFGSDTLSALNFRDPESFATLDARYHFGTVLLHHRRAITALPGWLYASPAWKLAYLDDVNVVFVRAEGEGARVPELGLDTPGLFPAFDDEADQLARERFRARTRLLLALGRPDLAAQQWERCLARFPDEPRGREMLDALRARPVGEGAGHGRPAALPGKS